MLNLPWWGWGLGSTVAGAVISTGVSGGLTGVSAGVGVRSSGIGVGVGAGVSGPSLHVGEKSRRVCPNCLESTKNYMAMISVFHIVHYIYWKSESNFINSKWK